MVFTPDALEGKVVIITGGGTGIGKGIALEMSRAGAKVAIASRTLEHLAPTAEEIRALGAPCLVVQVDVRDRDQCDNLAKRVIDEYGHIDTLVNNAAGNFRINAEDLTVNGWNSVINIDLNGTFWCSRAVFPHMREHGGGNIINILAFTDAGGPNNVHAAAAKGGIWTMTMTLASEWGRYSIRVNAITPGSVPTLGTQRNLRLGLHPGDPDNIGGEDAIARMQGAPNEDIPLGRTGTPQDLGNAAVFLASDAASWITGAHLHVDGGGRLRRFRRQPEDIPS